VNSGGGVNSVGGSFHGAFSVGSWAQVEPVRHGVLESLSSVLWGRV